MGDTGDLAAFTEYAHTRAATLFRTAYLMVGDHQLAQDLLQEALVKTLMAWPRLRDRDDLEAYTRRIIVTTSISWRRRRSFHERPVEALPERAAAPDPADVVVTHDAVVAALSAVPPRQRAAIVLRYYQDLTEKQTAEAMGCSVGAVKSQVSAGLQRLRETLGPGFDHAASADEEVTP